MSQQELKNLLHELHGAQRAIERTERSMRPALPGVLTFTISVLATGLEALASLDDFEISNGVVDFLLVEAVGGLVDAAKRHTHQVSDS
jgi:hypothetical protein